MSRSKTICGTPITRSMSHDTIASAARPPHAAVIASASARAPVASEARRPTNRGDRETRARAGEHVAAHLIRPERVRPRGGEHLGGEVRRHGARHEKTARHHDEAQKQEAPDAEPREPRAIPASARRGPMEKRYVTVAVAINNRAGAGTAAGGSAPAARRGARGTAPPCPRIILARHPRVFLTHHGPSLRACGVDERIQNVGESIAREHERGASQGDAHQKWGRPRPDPP